MTVLIVGVALGITLTYVQFGPGPSCAIDANCGFYKDRIAITCTDGGSYTGLVPGVTKTNTVTVNKYINGTCSSGTCTGGSLVETDPGTVVVDTPCVQGKAG